jgi:hypothetical protein
MRKNVAFLLILLTFTISGCDGEGDSKNLCFSRESTNTCFDSNQGGITTVVTAKTVEQVISEERQRDDFQKELETTHITKSFSTTISDFQCFEAMSESELIIKTRGDWVRFRNSCFFSEYPLSDRDFSAQMAIIAIDDKDGVGINIESVLEFNSEIVVIITDDVIMPLEDFPRFRFHIVTVPKVDKTVNFIRVKGSGVNICFSKDSSETCSDSNLGGTTTTVLDKSIEEVIAEEKGRDGFSGELGIETMFEHKVFSGPPESFLNPECVDAWKENAGVITNKEDWDEFRISCFFFIFIPFFNLPEVDFSEEIVLFSIQDTDGLGTIIETILEFEGKQVVVIRDDQSDAPPPIRLFPFHLILVQRTEFPFDFIRVKNPAGIDVVRGCLGKKAFSTVPGCLAESIVLFGSLRCDCEGDRSGSFTLDFGFVVNGAASPIVSISDIFFGLEDIDCATLSLLGQGSGTLEQMNTPRLGVLEFLKTMNGGTEAVSCNCIEEPCQFGNFRGDVN